MSAAGDTKNKKINRVAADNVSLTSSPASSVNITRGHLRQLRHLKREIELLQDQIADFDSLVDGLPVVTDRVRGSDSEYPYVERGFIIRGRDPAEYQRRVKRLQRKLERRRDDYMALVEEMNEFIERIDDSLVRQIIALRHINGLSWDQVAAHIGGGNTAEGVRQIHSRFFRDT